MGNTRAQQLCEPLSQSLVQKASKGMSQSQHISKTENCCLMQVLHLPEVRWPFRVAVAVTVAVPRTQFFILNSLQNLFLLIHTDVEVFLTLRTSLFVPFSSILSHIAFHAKNWLCDREEESHSTVKLAHKESFIRMSIWGSNRQTATIRKAIIHRWSDNLEGSPSWNSVSCQLLS
jgi:hypothetical protein